MSGVRYRQPTVDGLPLSDWDAIGRILLEREMQIESADDFQAVLREIRRDARIRCPKMVSERKVRLVMRLVQMGRVHEIRGDRR